MTLLQISDWVDSEEIVKISQYMYLGKMREGMIVLFLDSWCIVLR